MKIALPKGHLFESTKELLAKSGIVLDVNGRNYKPNSNCQEFEFRIIKPRNIPKMVEEGLVDLGIIGTDLVQDENAKVELVLDLKTMPVYLVVAATEDNLNKDKLKVASEYTEITRKYFESKGKKFSILKTYGSTECFVPEFADVIVDHVQSGSSLRENNLKVLDLIMKSTTHLIANRKAPKNLVELFKSKLLEGMKLMDFTYPQFLNGEQIIQEFGVRK